MKKKKEEDEEEEEEEEEETEAWRKAERGEVVFTERAGRGRKKRNRREG